MLWHILFFFYHLLSVAYIVKGNLFSRNSLFLPLLFGFDIYILIPAFIRNKTGE